MKLWISLFLCLPALLAVAEDEVSEKPAQDVVAAEEYNLATTDRLTGSWNGVRTDFEDAGVNFSMTIGSVTQWNMLGGLNTHNAFENTGEVTYDLELGLNKLISLEGGTLFIKARSKWGDPIEGDVGGICSPYGGPGGGGDVEIELKKYWWRQRLFDDRLEARVGMIDAEDLIDGSEYAESAGGQFPNTVLEHNPTIPFTKGLGISAKVWPVDWLYVLAVVADPDTITTHNRRGTGGYDTVFDGEKRFHVYGELGILPHYLPNVNCLPGHYRFGVWRDASTKDRFMDDLGGLREQRVQTGDVGWYISLDQMIWKENEAAGDEQGLGLFARYGFAHADVNFLNHFWSMGASYKGLIPARDDDVMGLGFAQSIVSKKWRDNFNRSADRETVCNMYYKIKIAPWLFVTPDLQFIANPGGTGEASDALAGGVRLQIRF